MKTNVVTVERKKINLHFGVWCDFVVSVIVVVVVVAAAAGPIAVFIAVCLFVVRLILVEYIAVDAVHLFLFFK